MVHAPEFRGEVAKLVIETSRSIADVARECGLNEISVGSWVKKYHTAQRRRRATARIVRAAAAKLERRNREPEMELAFMKKAAAYFAREQR